MKPREFDPLKLDVQAFAKAGASMEGRWPLAELKRLAGSSVHGSTEVGVSWRVQGELRAVRAGQPEIWLHVQSDAEVLLECQRCLGAVSAEIHAKRSFLFVHGEEIAAELDADLEDDVLALTRVLDLRALVEDELLLELPLVPRHETCPQPLSVASEPDELEKEPSPFAALASLKRGSLPN